MEEQRQHKRRQRGAAKGMITKKIKEIEELIFNNEERKVIEENCSDLEKLLATFLRVHEEYLDLLEEEEDKEEANMYMNAVKENTNEFISKKTLLENVKSTSNEPTRIPIFKTYEEEINPDDSISQISSRQSHRSERAKAALKRHELKVKLETLKQQQLLEAEELKIRQKKEQLDLQANFEIAQAHEEIFSNASGSVH